MREAIDDPLNGWVNHQQQTGESTNSSFADHVVEYSQEKMRDSEQTLHSIAHLLTQLLIDDPLVLLEKEKSPPVRKRRRRREDSSSLSPVASNRILRNTTPEREIPSKHSSEDLPLQSFIIGTITPDSTAPDLVQLDFELDEDDEENEDEMERRFRSRSWANQKLAEALFSHPQSLRTFCVEAYQTAKQQSLNISTEENDKEEDERVLIRNNNFHNLTYSAKIPRHIFFENPLLSITLDAWSVVQEITLDVSFATVSVTVMVLDASVHIVMNVWGGVTRFNPLVFVTRPFNMMGMTTEVVVSGIQSVATGVGSASSLALNRLSVKNRSPLSSGMVGSQGNLRRVRSPAKARKIINQKLLQKLNDLNSAAPVVSYTELGDNDGGLSRHAKNRVQRMMHYDVSLRPFVATIKLQETFKKESQRNNDYSFFDEDENDDASDSSSTLDGPFMCTPQSFPPTPASRAHVLKRGSRFADDVVFLARDQLRVHDALESSNERTREMAQALTHGKRLAVFDADDACAGIDLSCGQHVATKVGNLLYCSSRSMVPILRNCFVYFEMTVLGRSGGLIQPSMTTLSFGLSTKEMPSTTLVGAWKGSVGLCTTGQILISGQWCSPGPDPSIGPFGDRETVGCLVCLDDSSAFETWEGVMITATVIFNINGRIVSPHLPSAPVSGPGGHPLAPAQTIGAVPVSCSLPLLVPAEEELYPTLTLHSPGTSVMCRFSAGDVTAVSREAIGAPPGVAVYAVDGSIVFNEEII